MNVVVILLGLVVAVLAAGQRAKAKLSAQYPPPGQMVDVGGYRLHIQVQGEGSPTVVMDAGVGGIGLHWALVQPEIAKLTRVCVYDRAGMGWSEPSPKPRTADVLAEELHTLLTRASIAAPYILVGHSYGGVVLRQFTQRYPAEVAGMVLVDSAHEEQFGRFPKPMLDSLSKMMPMMKVMNLFFTSGIPALRVSSMPLDSRVPTDIAETDRAVRAVNPRHMAAQIREFEVITRNQNPTVGSLGDIPLIVLSHGKPQPMPNLPPEVNEAYEQVWQQMQVEQAALSSRSQRMVAEKSGHDIQLEQPELVINAIKEILAAARATP